MSSPGPAKEPYAEALARVIAEVVEPGAAEVDATGSFPRKQIDALADAGILGLTVPAGLGGGDAGLREAATVVRELGAVCGSTAMIVTMHYAATAALAATAAAAESAGIPADIAAVRRLQDQMDEGRRRRLAYIGFPDDEAAELSALHTRNFM